jgi:hypothetical protein
MMTSEHDLRGIGDVEDFAPPLPAGVHEIEPLALDRSEGVYGVVYFLTCNVTASPTNPPLVGKKFQCKLRISGKLASQTAGNLRDFKGTLKCILAHNQGVQQWIAADCPPTDGLSKDQMWERIVQTACTTPEFLRGSRVMVDAVGKQGVKPYTIYKFLYAV